METSATHGNMEIYKKVESTEAFVLKETLKVVCKISNDLNKSVEQNTKRDIKDLISKLRRQADILKRKTILKWLEGHKYGAVEKITIDSESQTDKKGKDMAFQTDEEGAIKTIIRTETYEEWVNIAERKWSEESYTDTKVKMGNPLEDNLGMTKVTLVGPKILNLIRGSKNYIGKDTRR